MAEWTMDSEMWRAWTWMLQNTRRRDFWNNTGKCPICKFHGDIGVIYRDHRQVSGVQGWWHRLLRIEPRARCATQVSEPIADPFMKCWAVPLTIGSHKVTVLVDADSESRAGVQAADKLIYALRMEGCRYIPQIGYSYAQGVYVDRP